LLQDFSREEKKGQNLREISGSTDSGGFSSSLPFFAVFLRGFATSPAKTLSLGDRKTWDVSQLRKAHLGAREAAKPRRKKTAKKKRDKISKKAQSRRTFSVLHN
jgi:hypothetical protein